MWGLKLSDKFNVRDRKLDHIKIVIEEPVEAGESTFLEYIRIPHKASPNINLNDVDVNVSIYGKNLGAPIVITGMTGGHPETAKINEALATIADKYNIGLGVGSQRAAIEDTSLAYTFKIVREVAPKTFIIANIGGPQLVKGYGLKEAELAVKMIEADALAIHLNPAQEAFQIEGEPYYKGLIRRVKELVDTLGVPIIIKETGTGLDRVSIKEFWSIGVDCFDVSGLGGTNWVKVEVLRARRHSKIIHDPGEFPDYWGNPTALAIIEARIAAPEACIIASGGIRSGIDIAKAIVLGADLGGIALPALKALLKGGIESLDKYVNDLIWQLKVSMFLSGSRSLNDLKMLRPSLWGRLLDELASRGITLNQLMLAKFQRVLSEVRKL